MQQQGTNRIALDFCQTQPNGLQTIALPALIVLMDYRHFHLGFCWNRHNLHILAHLQVQPSALTRVLTTSNLKVVLSRISTLELPQLAMTSISFCWTRLRLLPASPNGCRKKRFPLLWELLKWTAAFSPWLLLNLPKPCIFNNCLLLWQGSSLWATSNYHSLSSFAKITTMTKTVSLLALLGIVAIDRVAGLRTFRFLNKISL